MISRKILSVGVVAAGLSFASAAHAITATTDWSNPSGSAAAFDWANGHDTTNLFGSPTVAGNTFTFNPAAFSVSDSTFNPLSGLDVIGGLLPQDGPPVPEGNTVSDTFYVDIHLKPGYQLFGVSYHEEGAYDFTFGGVNASGTLHVQDLNSTDTQTNVVITNPMMPTGGLFGSGDWTGDASLDLTDHDLRISVDNSLNASALFSADISKTSAALTIDARPISAVPLPPALAMVPFGFAAAAWARRRLRRTAR